MKTSASRAVPLEFGQRLTGKAGRFGIGALNIQAGEDPTGTVSPTNFTVMRVKRDVLRRSYVGAIVTNRSTSVTAGRGSNQAYGVDSMFSFYENLFVSSYYARTQTPGLVVGARDNSYQTELNYNGDRYGAQIDHMFVGDGFNPEVGFLPRKDFRRSYASGRFSPRPRSMPRVRKFTLDGTLEYIASGAGVLESRSQRGRFNTEFENSDTLQFDAGFDYELLVRPFAIARSVTIPAGGYGFGDVQASYSMGAQRRVSGTLTARRGTFYGGTITAASFTGARVTVVPRFSFEPSITLNRVELPFGAFTAKLFRSRADYAFTPRMFASGLLQYNASDRTFSSNVRFRWEYLPGSELFVVYTDERDTGLSGLSRLPTLRNRGFVVKINRLFQF